MTELLETTFDRWGERCERLIHTADGPKPVEVFAEYHAEVLTGPMKGRTLECFAWLHRRERGHEVNISELKTGHRLAEMPILTDGRRPVDVKELDPEAMLVLSEILTKASREAAFEIFRQADDEEIVALFQRLDELVARFGQEMGVLYG